MTEQQPSHEKQEKDEKSRESEEKAEEKQHEKQEEKSWEEKWRRDPLGAAIWAAILIWAGIALLAENLGLLDRFKVLEELSAWSVVLAGAGVIVLGEAVIRVLVPAYRRPVVGTVIFGMILLGIGLGSTVGWQVIWPLVLIALGVIFLLGGFVRRR